MTNANPIRLEIITDMEAGSAEQLPRPTRKWMINPLAKMSQQNGTVAHGARS